MQPIIIDVEASGFGRGSYPIEIGVADAERMGSCNIVRRKKEWQHWDPRAEMLHGISRQTLAEHGKEPAVIASLLNEQLAGQLVYSDAWGNDSSWIALLFDAADIIQRFRLEPLRSLLSDGQLGIWHATKEQVIAEMGYTRHRASHDALILQQTFCQTAELAGCQQIG